MILYCESFIPIIVKLQLIFIWAFIAVLNHSSSLEIKRLCGFLICLVEQTSFNKESLELLFGFIIEFGSTANT